MCQLNIIFVQLACLKHLTGGHLLRTTRTLLMVNKKQDQEYSKPTLYVLLPTIACKGMMGEWGSAGSE